MNLVRAYRRPRTVAREDIARYEADTPRLRLDPRASRGARETLSRVPSELHDRVTWRIGFDAFGLAHGDMMYIDVRNFNNRVKPGVEAYVSWGPMHASVHGMGTVLEVRESGKSREHRLWYEAETGGQLPRGQGYDRQSAEVLVDFDGVQAWVRGHQITAVLR